jgi:biotin-dependent carboxylase-like uncharacterized protein
VTGGGPTGLRVIDAGLHSSVQDFGRPGRRGFGVPLQGAADRWSLSLGNLLLGNPPDAPALEITLRGPTVQAVGGDVGCVVFGAPFTAAVGSRPQPPGTTFTLPRDAVLRIGGTPTGARAYLCVVGGFAAPRWAGSASAEAPVAAGDLLACAPATVGSARFAGRRIAADGTDWDSEPGVLRALPGTHLDLFPDDAVFGPEFRVAPQADRMGVRLLGTVPARRPAGEMLSEPVVPGTVQIPPAGRPIVLGVAAQTIGGYPRAAQVIAADVDKIGRLRPGDPVRFRRVDSAEARRALTHKAAELSRWVRRLRNR